jgi:molybdopterin/thiamine biosynthesis adenylyltransferase
MMDHDQLAGLSKTNVTVYDFDIVEEKNLRHQDFKAEDLAHPKSFIMTVRYEFPSAETRFEERHLTDHSHYAICADNPGVRRLVYEHCMTYDKPFIDMRAEGDRIAIFTHLEDPHILRSSLGEEPENTEGRSCQTVIDTQENRIQMGNAVVAPMGVQMYMRLFREEAFPRSIIEVIDGSRTVRR